MVIAKQREGATSTCGSTTADSLGNMLEMFKTLGFTKENLERARDTLRENDINSVEKNNDKDNIHNQ